MVITVVVVMFCAAMWVRSRLAGSVSSAWVIPGPPPDSALSPDRGKRESLLGQVQFEDIVACGNQFGQCGWRFRILRAEDGVEAVATERAGKRGERPEAGRQRQRRGNGMAGNLAKPEARWHGKSSVKAHFVHVSPD
jgi:hypothetical protein